MKKLLALSALFLAMTLCLSAQTLLWKTFPVPKGLISNFGAIAEGMRTFDYQAARFGEYKQDQTFLLRVIVFQIQKDGNVYGYSCYDRYNENDLIVIRSTQRFKYVNTGRVAYFLCTYAFPWTVTTRNKETGVKNEEKVPIFDASKAWTTLDISE